MFLASHHYVIQTIKDHAGDLVKINGFCVNVIAVQTGPVSLRAICLEVQGVALHFPVPRFHISCHVVVEIMGITATDCGIDATITCFCLPMNDPSPLSQDNCFLSLRRFTPIGRILYLSLRSSTLKDKSGVHDTKFILFWRNCRTY